MVESNCTGWIQAVVRALDDQGIDGTKLALQAGLSIRTLRNGTREAPQSAVAHLWKLAVEATGDPCFGLHAARFFTFQTFRALNYAIFTSPNMKVALRRIVRFQRLLNDATTQRVERAGDRYRFVIDRTSPMGPPDEAIDASMATAVLLFRTLSDSNQVRPMTLRLQRKEPRNGERYAAAFRCPVAFGAERNVAEFARRDIEKPLPSVKAEQARRDDAIVTEYLARNRRCAGLAHRVHELLVDYLPDGGHWEESIAQRLCMSTRKLQLELAEQNTSYKELLNRARRDLACGYLREAGYSIKEIAFLLSFADAATFTRAFRRWTGDSPRRFANQTGPAC